LETKDFSAVTPEIEALAAKSRENNRIDISLYDKYEVKRGLRDLNGKGVLTGLTEISEVKASEVDENGVSHPCDGKLYYRGHDVEKLIEGFTKDKRFGFEEVTYLLLFGDTGVGKTFLSNCVAKELLDTGHSVIYFSAHHLFELLAQKTFTREPQAAKSYRNIFDCDLLIIDDLGTELTNTFTTSQFFVCLNERIRKQKSTLISTNLELFDIASIYSERIFSRISNSFIILHLFGNDIRLCKKLTEK